MISEPDPTGPPQTSQQLGELLADWIGSLTANTKRAYLSDYAHLAEHLQIKDNQALIEYLATLNAGQANHLALTWKRDLLESYSPSTINRRLSSLRELVRTLRTMGVVYYQIEVKGVKGESRDMSGPTLAQLQKMIGFAHELAVHTNEKKARKGAQLVAIIRLLFDIGLRRAEVSHIDLADVREDSINILQKGKTIKAPLSIPEETRKALDAWIKVREGLALDQDALFVNGSGDRLTPDYIYQLIRWVGQKAAGIKAWPHGLRHTAITTAFEKASQHELDLTHLKQFSRHKKLDTLLVYRDKVENVQGRVASIVARQLE